LFFAPVPPGMEDSFDGGVAGLAAAGDADVIEDGEIAEQADILEGTGDALGGDFVRLAPDQFVIFEPDAAAGGPVNAGDEVEHGCFAGAIRADEAGDLAGLEGEVEVIDGAQAAEEVGYPADVKQGQEVSPFGGGRRRWRAVRAKELTRALRVAP